ncbi:MAG: hypothetical protein PSN34_11745 [Urechidicola sp.]|nr:hypothetical protein [Urechidicola sp.]
MKYKNIFEFLDVALADNPSPSKEDIANAKSQYYKAWHRHYNRQRRTIRKEFTLGFTPEILKRIENKKGTLTVSKYLYNAIYDALNNGNATVYDLNLLSNIHQQLLHLMTLLEELLDSGVSPQIELLLERIEQLELQFNKL